MIPINAYHCECPNCHTKFDVIPEDKTWIHKPKPKDEDELLSYPYREWLIMFYEGKKLLDCDIAYLLRIDFIYLDQTLRKPKYKLTTLGKDHIKRLKKISPCLRFK